MGYDVLYKESGENLVTKMKINILTKTEIEELIKIRTKFLRGLIDKLKGRIDLIERKQSNFRKK